MNLHTGLGGALIAAIFAGLFIAGVRFLGWRAAVFAYAFTATVTGLLLVAALLIEGHL